MKTNLISIHQTLHGYQNGHSLLASSLELPTEVKRTLLIMSDMSGGTMEQGFEEYITVYPIKAINHMAIAKTWYAPEMKRPGCVWTHTLLISFADLAQLPIITVLRKFFQRPNKSDNREYYSKHFELDRNETYDIISINWPKKQLDLIKLILFNLYENVENSIVISDESSLSYDDIFFGIWSQQWPRLRRVFSFCTGSINLRQFQQEYLDLQIVPKFIKHSSSEIDKIIYISDESIAKANDEWLELLVDDLLKPSSFRLFCRKYGSDIPAERKSFKLLLNCYLYLLNESEKDLAGFIKLLSTNFPSKNDAFTLKSSIFSKEQRMSNFNFRFLNQPVENLLYDLSTTEYYQSFNFL